MNSLVRYDAACRAIAAAKAVDEVKDIRDKAEAMRIYARQAKNRELEIDAAEIRLRAERRLGEMIVEQKATVGLNRGTAGAGDANVGRGTGGAQSEPPVDQRPTLAEAGIDKKLSSRAQKLAAVPAAKFEAQLGEWRERVAEENERVTTNLIREGEKAQRRQEHAARALTGGKVEDLHALIGAGVSFGAIYADPAWLFKTRSERGEGRAPDYTRQTLDEIKAMPVGALAAPDCALFMWAIDPLLDVAFDVLRAWGFTYKTVAFTWVKLNACGDDYFMGPGFWTRANPEMCLFATRGNPVRRDAGVRQLVVAPLGEHSEKPDEVHERIERLVDGPYLELYARRERPGWLTWGNELAFTGEIPAAATVAAEEGSGGGPEAAAPRPRLSADDIDLTIPPFLRRTRASATDPSRAAENGVRDGSAEAGAAA